jgi:hypothetical protein
LPALAPETVTVKANTAGLGKIKVLFPGLASNVLSKVIEPVITAELPLETLGAFRYFALVGALGGGGIRFAPLKVKLNVTGEA